MENYICINGKKAELTEEQLKALGIELPKENPFKRLSKTKPFYFITNKGKVELGVEVQDFHCEQLYGAANYCADKAIMQQRALHETLNRLLWRYSMEHKANRIDDKVWSITYNKADKELRAGWVNYQILFLNEVVFDTEEIAENAIKEVIKPFMKAHPEFKW